MTLAKARAEANKAFKATKAAVLARDLSPRSASEGLIGAFWNIDRELKAKDKVSFYTWFNRKHDALGKELAMRPSRRGG